VIKQRKIVFFKSLSKRKALNFEFKAKIKGGFIFKQLTDRLLGHPGVLKGSCRTGYYSERIYRRG
jgi:hypothetical protein